MTGVRRRRANVNHIEPLQDSIEIKRGAADDEVEGALKTAHKLDDMAKIVKPVLG